MRKYRDENISFLTFSKATKEDIYEDYAKIREQNIPLHINGIGGLDVRRITHSSMSQLLNRIEYLISQA